MSRRSTMQRAVPPGLTVFVLFAILVGSACGGSGERVGRSGERPSATAPCRPGSSAEPADTVTVTLFHETHTHGNLAGTPDRPRNVTFARYVGLRNALRACLREPANSLFLGNGDDLSPTLNGVRTDGRHTIDAFNAAGIDADTFGFNELHVLSEDSPPSLEDLAQLRELVTASRFAWVSANVREGRNPDQVFASEQGARRWIIKDVGGVRIGITGLISASAAPGIPALPPGLEASMRILDPAQAMREIVPQMRTAGARIVVVLSHMSAQETRRVARSMSGIDVALGTHLGEPTPQPEIVNGTIVAVAGPDEMQALGQLDLTIRHGRIVDHAFRRHVPSPSQPADPEVERVLARYPRRS
jgi:5'-nucleotidase / UDP-sugar diphosphatase